MKVILDTDIGSDIDDAVCLAYLLAQPECDLLGITTVTGEPVRRAQMASALCQVAGKDIPIYPGAASPLLIPTRQAQAPQADMLDKWPHNTDFPTGQAVEFLRRTIRAHPGEITLLTIGPLTNIGLLFATDPEIPSLLRGLVIMGGYFLLELEKAQEWNIILDPHAAAIVYRAAPPLHRSVGIDVTSKVTMPPDEVRRRFDTPLLRPVRDFAEVWFRDQPKITFHDPLAAVTLFDESVCTFERGRVNVLHDGDQRGATLWRADANGPHEIATQVDPNRFFDLYFGVFA